MEPTLTRIKRAILDGRYRFTIKADDELYTDGLILRDALESILNAPAITKKIRSTSGNKAGKKEMLYIIESPNYDGMVIYTKGKFQKRNNEDVYYILISSKRSR